MPHMVNLWLTFHSTGAWRHQGLISTGLLDTQKQTDGRHEGREEGTRDDSKTAVRETLVAGLKETSSPARGQTGWEGGVGVEGG